MDRITRTQYYENKERIKTEQKEIAKGLKSEGYSNKEIADRMGLAESSVRFLLHETKNLH